jgi:hypothetical protein
MPPAKSVPGFLALTWPEAQDCSAIVPPRGAGLGEILACFPGTQAPGYDSAALRAEHLAPCRVWASRHEKPHSRPLRVIE